MYQQTIDKRELLLRYLQYYLSKKDLKMKNVLKNIQYRIQNNKRISIRQYNSIIKFIEREKEFKNSDRDQIYRFFEPLIEQKGRFETYGNTLTEHLR